MNKRQIIEKPVLYGVFELFGPNILTLREREWKKHRVLATPAFSESNLRLVIKSTNMLLGKMIAKWDDLLNQNPKNPINLSIFTTQLTFGVISNAGFGIEDNEVFENNSKMNLRVAFDLMFRSIYIHDSFPWLLNLPFFGFPRVKKAYEMYEVSVQNLVKER